MAKSIQELKALIESKNDSVAKMESIIAKAESEKRDLSKEEQLEFDKLLTETRAMSNKIQVIEEQRAINIATPGKLEIRAIKDVVLPNEKIEKRAYTDNSNELMDFGNLVRGMAGKGWDGAEKEKMHYRAMQSAENSVVIPQSLADKIVDVARTKSAFFGKVPVVQMTNNNLSIAIQTDDPVANFVNEGELIPTGKAIFTSVDLKGKTLAIFIPISEQLLESASNLGNQLMNSCAMAIGLALDKAMIYGKGIVEGSPTEIKGISEYITINKVEHKGANLNYDLLISGLKNCKASNVEPNNIVYGTDISMDLAMLKDSQGQYITRPLLLDKYDISESNNVAVNESYIYDSNSLLLGLQKGVTMEWGTSGDMFQRIQKGLRIYIRADLALINAKGITQAKFIKTI